MNSQTNGRSRRQRPPRRFTQLAVLDPADVKFRRLPQSQLEGGWSTATSRWFRAIQLLPDVAQWTESDWIDFETTVAPMRERYVRAVNSESLGISSIVALSGELRRGLARFGLGPAERQKQRVSLIDAETAEAKAQSRRGPKAVADVKTPAPGEPVPLSHDEARAHVLGNRTAG